jgi:preprotein translocase subunit YajC
MQPSPNLLVQMLPFVLMLGIFYFLVLRPMRKRQKQVSDFQSALKIGDRVILTSGIYGQVTKLSDKTVKVQIADRVIVEVARASVGGLQGSEPLVTDQNNSTL